MSSLNAFLLLLLVAGHTELLVALVNRLHALPIGCGTLRQVRHVHDVLVPLFPLLLLWSIGLNGPRLLEGGNWWDVSIPWRVYLAICALGTCGLAVSMVRYRRGDRSTMVASNHTRTIDVAREMGARPLGHGPFRWLTRVPGNQAFEIDVARKELRLPRLPAEWDGLSILHLSDWHFIGTIDRPYFERAADLAAEQRADLIVFTGDLLDRQDLIEWIAPTLGRLSAPLGNYFILGNHDWYLDAAAIRAELSRLGWHDVAGRVATVEHAGGTLAIGGTERPWMGNHPEYSQETGLRILLSHTPDNLGWARSQGVDLMLSGHNHGGQVVLPVIGPVYSPSLTGCRYAAGTFWEPPTLLHVSRGLSGRHPLRIRCRPEVTALVLRAGPRTAG
jgi:predicted MPP superfamily phosphohydrolase